MACRSSTCPACAQRIAASLQRAFRAAAGTLVFFRLSYPDDVRPSDPLLVARHWHDFNQRMRRTFSAWALTPWFRRIERGDKLGHLHIHCVAKVPGAWRLGALKRLIVAAWDGSELSVRVDFPARAGKVVAYLCSYVTVFSKTGVGNLSKSQVLCAMIRAGVEEWERSQPPLRRRLCEAYFEADEFPPAFRDGPGSFWEPVNLYNLDCQEVVSSARSAQSAFVDAARSIAPLREESACLLDSRLNLEQAVWTANGNPEPWIASEPARSWIRSMLGEVAWVFRFVLPIRTRRLRPG